MDHESKTDNTKRRPSVPSALHLRSVFSPRPRPPLARLSRSIFSCRSNRESDNLASNLLTNQHNNFYDIVSSARYVDSIALLKRNECSIVSSHADSISSLDFDNTCEGRFLLSGSSDGTISAYDVSPSGSEYVLDGGISSISSKNGHRNSRLEWERARLKKMAEHKPVARSYREPPINALTSGDDPTYCPSGHAGAVSSVQWYPVDTGAFVSTDRSGQILIWDTNQFIPVSSVRVPGSIQCAEMARYIGCTSTLLAIGIRGGSSSSGEDRAIRLCDVRSGATSHNLMGHGPRGGINSIKWKDEFCLFSGGEDGTIRFWDVRKSGSGSCLLCLDREQDCSSANQPQPNGKLRNVVGPSDYSQVEARHIRSHEGPISSLSLTPDGTTLVSTGRDRRVTVWDVQHAILCQYRPLPTAFLGPDESNSHPIDANAKRFVAATIVQAGSSGTATLWLSGPGCQLLGYGVNGPGGRPDVVLSGHLDAIRSIVCHENAMRLYTGGDDGMILAWGCPGIGKADDSLDYFARARQRRRQIRHSTRSNQGVDLDCW